MSLSDLASLGSFVSGIAVIISLITLLVQMRQNAHVLIRAEANAAQEQMSNWRLTLATSADLTNIWTKGSRDEDLSATEETRYSFLLQDLTFALFQSWDRANRGIIGAELYKRVGARFAPRLTTKRGAAWWKQNSDLFQADFVASIDAAIRNSQANGSSVP